MDGIYVRIPDTSRFTRPKSKKAIREAIRDPRDVVIEVTRFGHEREISLVNILDGEEFHFVGPDPYRDRRFYGTIGKRNGKVYVK